MIVKRPVDTSAWMALLGVFVSALGFAGHTTYQLGQIKGSLDRDLVQLRLNSDDHERRLRQLERPDKDHVARVK